MSIKKKGSFFITCGQPHQIAALMRSIHSAPALIELIEDGVVKVSIMDPVETNGMLTTAAASLLLKELDEELARGFLAR